MLDNRKLFPEFLFILLNDHVRAHRCPTSTAEKPPTDSSATRSGSAWGVAAHLLERLYL